MEDLNRLNDAQRAAVITQATRALIVAGPGSGKTESLVSRVRYLVVNGANPKRIVVITFTNSAAAEIRSRLTRGANPVEGIGYIGTLHGYCLRLLEAYGCAIGYRPNVGVIDEDRAEKIVASVLAELSVKLSGPEWSAAKSEYGTLAAFVEPATKRSLAVARYYVTLKRGNVTDYDGLLWEAIRLLEKTTGAPDQRPRIEYLLVDEYQDSTKRDQRIYELLAPDATWIVGDPDQAIYTFRGGDITSILAMAATKNYQCHVFSENYRCDEKICEAANRLIDHNEDRIEKHTVSKTGRAGEVCFHEFADDEQERRAVLNEVAELLARSDASGGYRPEDIAILARTNHIVNDFTFAATSMFRFSVAQRILRPEDTIFGWKYALATVDMLSTPANDFVFRYWMESNPATAAAADTLARDAAAKRQSMAITYFDRFPSCPTLEAAPDALTELGVSPQAVVAVSRLISSLPASSSLPDLSLALRSFSSSVADEEARKGITITTIHGAKGREWPVVFLVGLEAEVTPTKAAFDGGPEAKAKLEEERRLIFVAATRAARKLVLSCAQRRASQWGKRTLQIATLSPFVQELLAPAV